ncbi:MAG: HypC/HybG/HupF family hydrogenase formation chaperone [Lachnospiraceae bacterium]|nr:HypC/HybG/HupF family hydrogenase formation chaperone [Lachnospiraceae bacterium]
MCVAYPGTVISVGEHTAKVDFSGTQVEAQTGLEKVKPGDRVLVHAGCVMQILTESDADAMEELFAEIAQMENGDRNG